MANKSLFGSTGAKAPATDTVNNAGGAAYSMTDRHALAQLAATNCFNGTFYATAESSLDLAKQTALKLKNDPLFIAKVAVYSRQKGYMKDMPAFLTVLLSEIDTALFHKVFDIVVDNGRMLRNVVQMARSGAVTGKKHNMSAGAWRRAIQRFFDRKSDGEIFKASIGNSPSLNDVLKMARPRPNSATKSALFGYITGRSIVTHDDPKQGREISISALPEIVQQYERFKLDKTLEVPNVDFRQLDSLGLTDAHWKTIAANAPWQMARMNINTFARHGVFKDAAMVESFVKKLTDRESIKKARAFPYQLFAAFSNTDINDNVPLAITNALQDAMEIAIDNVPVLPGKGLVCVDTSGSMSSPITGYTSGRHASKMKCSDIAGLIASAIARKNADAHVYTFSDTARRVKINPRDSVMTNTRLLSQHGGGTNISAPMVTFNSQGIKADWILYVSDNESWLDNGRGWGYTSQLASEWETFKRNNKHAKLICCDLVPNTTSQINERKDVLQVGGFSDTVFDVIESFVKTGNSAQHWVDEINKIELK